jgi:hypothetical protein
VKEEMNEKVSIFVNQHRDFNRSFVCRISFVGTA